MVPSLCEGRSLAPTASSFLTIRQAAQFCNCHPNTLRTAFRQHRLKVHRLTAGNALSRTRFKVSDLEEWMGGSEPGIAGKVNGDEPRAIPVGLIARVSTHAQKEDLQRQLSKLEAYASEHLPNAHITKYVRITSGLNMDSPVLIKLLRDICEGKFSGGYLICTFKDRCLRMGFKLILALCKLHNVQMIQCEAEEPKSLMDELVTDILNLTHCCSASMYGRRSSRNHYDICPTISSDIVKWHKAGLSLKAIYKRLEEQGRCTDGRNQPFKVATVRRIVEQAKASLSLVDGNDSSAISQFAQFWKAKVVISKSKETRVDREAVLKAYAAWLKAKLGDDAPQQTRRQCLQALSDYLSSLPSDIRQHVQVKNSQHPKTLKRKRVLTGISLLGNRWDSP